MFQHHLSLEQDHIACVFSPTHKFDTDGTLLLAFIDVISPPFSTQKFLNASQYAYYTTMAMHKKKYNHVHFAHPCLLDDFVFGREIVSTFTPKTVMDNFSDLVLTFKVD